MRKIYFYIRIEKLNFKIMFNFFYRQVILILNKDHYNLCKTFFLLDFALVKDYFCQHINILKNKKK
jgi:hypothetical protein